MCCLILTIVVDRECLDFVERFADKVTEDFVELHTSLESEVYFTPCKFDGCFTFSINSKHILLFQIKDLGKVVVV